jgi:hypothetical protein
MVSKSTNFDIEELYTISKVHKFFDVEDVTSISKVLLRYRGLFQGPSRFLSKESQHLVSWIHATGIFSFQEDISRRNFNHFRVQSPLAASESQESPCDCSPIQKSTPASAESWLRGYILVRLSSTHDVQLLCSHLHPAGPPESGGFKLAGAKRHPFQAATSVIWKADHLDESGYPGKSRDIPGYPSTPTWILILRLGQWLMISLYPGYIWVTYGYIHISYGLHTDYI